MNSATCLRWLAVAALAAVSVGCATQVAYAPQSGEATARLRMIYSAQDSASYYSVYALDKCPADAPRVARGSVTAETAGSLGMPASQITSAQRSKEALIPAGKPVGVTLTSVKTQALRTITCHVPLRFDAVAQRDYEVEFRWLDNTRKCTAYFRQLNASVAPKTTRGARATPDVRRMEPSVRSVHVDFFSGPQFCAAP